MEIYWAIALFALTGAITPGPNNIMLLSSGLNFGVKKTMPHMFGSCIGFPVMIIAIGLGFSTVFILYPQTHQWIKILGIIYILYLAWRIANTTPNATKHQRTKPLTLMQAALFQWVNPKAWAVASALIAAYTNTENLVVQVFIIALICAAVALPANLIWIIFGANLKHLLKRDVYHRIFNITMAVLLVLSMSPVIWELLADYRLST